MADELEVATEPELELGTGEQEVEQEATEQSEGAEAQQAETAARPGDDWKTLKEVLREHPELHKRVKNALHTAANIEKTFPDGIKAVESRLKLLSQLDDNPDDPEYVAGSAPIEDVISNTLAERGFWRDFDNAFQQGSPAVINQMIEANPESFQKLIPQAMDRFAEVNPDGFSSYICRSVSGFMNDAQVPLQFALLAQILPEKSEDKGLQAVIDCIGRIRGVFDKIGEIARKPIEPKKQSEAGIREQGGEANLETREISLTNDEWLREVRPRSEKAMVDEIQRAYPGKRFTPAEVQQIKSALTQEVNARTRINSGYQARIRGFLKARNKSAYVMTAENEHKKIIRDAVKRAVDPVLAKRAKAKPGTQQNGQQARPAATVAQRNGAGAGNYRRIAKSPAQMGLAVDWSRTNNAMYAKEQAYIKGEKQPVRWGRA